MLNAKVLLLIASSLFSQNLASSDQHDADRTYDFPISLARFTAPSGAVPVSNLVVSAQDFDLTLNDGSAPVGRVALDDGPKRILILLDTSRDISDKQWPLEVSLAKALLGHARPQDLFSVHLSDSENEFDGFWKAESVQDYLDQRLVTRPESAETHGHLFDALKAATRRFGRPQFGDSILVFFDDDDWSKHTSATQVGGMLMTLGIRLYGVGLAGGLHLNTSPNLAFANANKGATFPSLPGPSIARVIADSGGLLTFGAGDGFGQKRLQGLSAQIDQYYAQIAAPYKVSVPRTALSKPARIQLKLKKDRVADFGHILVRHPLFLVPASNPG